MKTTKTPLKKTLTTLLELVTLESTLYACGILSEQAELQAITERHGREFAIGCTSFNRGINYARRIFVRDLCKFAPELRPLIRQGIRTGIKSHHNSLARRAQKAA